MHVCAVEQAISVLGEAIRPVLLVLKDFCVESGTVSTTLVNHNNAFLIGTPRRRVVFVSWCARVCVRGHA